MKAYQCSKCANLYDYDEYCQCSVSIDARPGHREKGNAETCKKNFELIRQEEKRWHEKFKWEEK